MNGNDADQSVEAAEFLAKLLHSVRHTPVGCRHCRLLSSDNLAVASRFRTRHFKSYDTPQFFGLDGVPGCITGGYLLTYLLHGAESFLRG